MLRSLLISILTAIGLQVTMAQSISDIGAAIQYCDTTAMQRIEGIWDMTATDCKVLICKDAENTYRAVVLESDDARLLPGSILATIVASAHPDQFRFTFNMGLKWNVECMATLTADDMALQIERPRHRIKLSPHLLLYRFWGLFKYDSKNPVEQIKDGMVRIYPHGKSSGANTFKVRYL